MELRQVKWKGIRKGLVMISLLFTSLANGQWVLTSEGFRVEDDQEFQAISYDVPLSQAELYAAARAFIIDTYASPGDVMTENEPNSILISGKEQQVIHRNNQHAFSMAYGIKVVFEHNQVIFEEPVFELYSSSAGKPQRLHLVFGSDLTGYDLGIYSPKGKLKSERAKQDLETFFNGWTNSLLTAIGFTP